MRTFSVLFDTIFLPVTARVCPKLRRPVFSKPVNPEDSAAVPMPDQLEIGHVLLIDVVGYSELVREEKQP